MSCLPPDKTSTAIWQRLFEVLDKTLSGNVVNDEKSFLDILDEPVTESVFPKESQVEQIHGEQGVTDILYNPATKSVSIPVGQVQQVEMKQFTTGVDASTTNVPKAEDDQSVTVDVISTLVSDSSVANEVETIPDDQFQQVKKEACVMNVPQRYGRKEETTNQQLLLTLLRIWSLLTMSLINVRMKLIPQTLMSLP